MKQGKFKPLVLFFIALCTFLFGTGTACLLRDGLGPDSIESHGFLAAQKVIEGSWLFILISVVVAFLGYRANLKPHNKWVVWDCVPLCFTCPAP